MLSPHVQVGMVFQSYALFNHMTVADNIKFGLQARPPAAAAAAAATSDSACLH
jgi:ABC-type sulfate/molybdate transport systems ATPase subunit